MELNAFDVTRWRPGPLLPRRDARDGALFFVVMVLSFLAVAAAILGLAADRAATGWTSQLVHSATVVVRPAGAETPDAAQARAAEVLSGVKGVTQAQGLEKAKAEALLRPWLGDETVLDDLPVPRLVTLDLDPDAPASAAALSAALKDAGVAATVDDHRLWIADIERGASLARWSALGVVVLITAAAVAVIAFATRAGLAAQREVVEVLHLAGAEAGFTADLFQWRFARMAALAGLFGGLAAAAFGALARLAGGGMGLTPVLPVAWLDLSAGLAAPILAALVAALSARAAALSLVREME
jgi:cell division transport system permease protein